MDFNMLIVSFVDIHDLRVDITGDHLLKGPRIFNLNEYNVFPLADEFRQFSLINRGGVNADLHAGTDRYTLPCYFIIKPGKFKGRLARRLKFLSLSELS